MSDDLPPLSGTVLPGHELVVLNRDRSYYFAGRVRDVDVAEGKVSVIVDEQEGLPYGGEGFKLLVQVPAAMLGCSTA